jgi:hypothetical protein
MCLLYIKVNIIKLENTNYKITKLQNTKLQNYKIIKLQNYFLT